VSARTLSLPEHLPHWTSSLGIPNRSDWVQDSLRAEDRNVASQEEPDQLALSRTSGDTSAGVILSVATYSRVVPNELNHDP